jgi:hypothetical protein
VKYYNTSYRSSNRILSETNNHTDTFNVTLAMWLILIWMYVIEMKYNDYVITRENEEDLTPLTFTYNRFIDEKKNDQ